MLRADNTTVIVLALQEPGGAALPMHKNEIILDMDKGMDHVPFPEPPYHTCTVLVSVTLRQNVWNSSMGPPCVLSFFLVVECPFNCVIRTFHFISVT